jgi:hypothetical protein
MRSYDFTEEELNNMKGSITNDLYMITYFSSDVPLWAETNIIAYLRSSGLIQTAGLIEAEGMDHALNEVFEDFEHFISNLKYDTKSGTGSYDLEIPESNNYLVVGMDHDSTGPFVTQIDGEPTSVKQAFDLLIPDEVRGKEYTRQGEWFLVPEQPSESAYIMQIDDDLTNIEEKPMQWGGPIHMLTRETFNISVEYAEYVGNVAISDRYHICQDMARTYSDGGGLWVRGHIYSNNHYTTYLKDWHRVYHNAEVINTDRS